MKKVLFVINNLETGGVQTSLLNLLKEIRGEFNVTLLTFFYRDSYASAVPGGVELKRTRSAYKYFGMSKKDSKKNPILFLKRTFWALLVRVLGRSKAIKLMGLFQPKLKGYDCAISFLHEGPDKNLYGGCNEFVLRKVQAKKKVGWLHCDFGQCGANTPESKKIYKKLDTVVGCSEGSLRSFVDCNPEFKDKGVAIRNCYDYDRIRSLSERGFSYDGTHFNVVTVARLAEEKGIERAIEAVEYCKSKGLELRYHVVGGGDQEGKLRELVEEKGLSDAVIFYGEQKNPYPYIKGADLFLLPSYHEAAPMVFDEAASLGVPVLATATTSTEDMLERSGYGIVCPNSSEGIKTGLEALLRNRAKLEAVRDRLKTERFSNDEAINNFRKIV